MIQGKLWNFNAAKTMWHCETMKLWFCESCDGVKLWNCDAAVMTWKHEAMNSMKAMMTMWNCEALKKAFNESSKTMMQAWWWKTLKLGFFESDDKTQLSSYDSMKDPKQRCSCDEVNCEAVILQFLRKPCSHELIKLSFKESNKAPMMMRWCKTVNTWFRETFADVTLQSCDWMNVRKTHCSWDDAWPCFSFNCDDMRARMTWNCETMELWFIERSKILMHLWWSQSWGHRKALVC